MREIKFRAWDEDEKEMINNVQNGNSGWHLGDFLGSEGFKVMEYTTQPTVDDEEIYEGDIVRFCAISPMSKVPDGFTGEVRWIECGFYVVNGENIHPLFDECREWEVVGNIYENPELLEQ